MPAVAVAVAVIETVSVVSRHELIVRSHDSCARLQARKRCEEMERDAEDAALEGRRTQAGLVSGPTFIKTSIFTHFMLWPAVYFTYTLSGSLPSLTLKLLTCVLVPVRRLFAGFMVMTVWRRDLSSMCKSLRYDAEPP